MKKKNMMMYIIIFIILLSGAVSFHVTADETMPQKQKVVKSVYIEDGDCIWNIAREYFQVENRNIESYVKEIKKCNNLSSDTIYAGQNLIIPYYE